MTLKPALVTLTTSLALLIGGGQLGVAQTSPRADATVERTWTDHTGTFTIEAKLVDFKDGVAHLKQQNGEIITILAERLSKADQEFLQAQASRPDDSLRGTLTRLLAEIELLERETAEICIGENKADPAAGVSESALTEAITRACQGSKKVKLVGEFASPRYELRTEAARRGDECLLTLLLVQRATGRTLARSAGSCKLTASLDALGYKAAFRIPYPQDKGVLRQGMQPYTKVYDLGSALFARKADVSGNDLAIWIGFDPGWIVLASKKEFVDSRQFNLMQTSLLEVCQLIARSGGNTPHGQVEPYTLRPDQLQIILVTRYVKDRLTDLFSDLPLPDSGQITWPEAQPTWAQVMCQGNSPPGVGKVIPYRVFIDNNLVLLNNEDDWQATDLSLTPGKHFLQTNESVVELPGYVAPHHLRPSFLIAAFFEKPSGRMISLEISRAVKPTTGTNGDVAFLSSRALSTLQVPVPPDTASP